MPGTTVTRRNVAGIEVVPLSALVFWFANKSSSCGRSSRRCWRLSARMRHSTGCCGLNACSYSGEERCYVGRAVPRNRPLGALMRPIGLADVALHRELLLDSRHGVADLLHGSLDLFRRDAPVFGPMFDVAGLNVVSIWLIGPGQCHLVFLPRFRIRPWRAPFPAPSRLVPLNCINARSRALVASRTA